MKTIALFGATGQTGRAFLRKALEAGYEIRALVRDPDKLKIKDTKLQITQGDVLDYDTVDDCIKGSDIVISLFGHVKGSPEWLQRDGTQHIVRAMQKHGVRKVISLSGGGLPFPEKDEPGFVDRLIRFIMKWTVPKILNDAIAHHRVLAESDRDWVIVRGPRLTNDPENGNYRVTWVGVNSGIKIGRTDLADFILKQVESDEYLYQMPFVTY